MVNPVSKHPYPASTVLTIHSGLRHTPLTIRKNHHPGLSAIGIPALLEVPLPFAHAQPRLKVCLSVVLQ
jgi:hypothetical protein